MARTDALDKISQTLTARGQVLRRRLGMELDGLGSKSPSAAGGDAADAAFDQQGEELAGQLAQVEAKELAQIEQALKRLKQGKYGLCEGCGMKIPMARLNALPYSTLCVACQRESERDSSFLDTRMAANWDALAAAGNEDREYRIRDLENDLTR
jgi:DnaK suppressor protein